jgi:glycosyltransferase involved in cell wall biosynthesis
MNKRIVVNISASVGWRRRPVGIIRVERELIKNLNLLIPDKIVPVYLDMRTTSWKGVKPQLFKKIIDDDWVLSDKPDNQSDIIFDDLTSFKPDKSDSFISVGSDWSFGIPDLVSKLYGGERVLVSACYDLIPLIFPEFTPGPEFFQQFNTHYTNIAKSAKSVFAISENSKKDLLNFWSENNLLLDAPPIEVIPLAGLNNTNNFEGLCEKDKILLERIKNEGKYIIYVSTLEPRKNHQILLDIWRDLFKDRGSNCPQLLIVGMRGWGSDDLIEQMSRMAVTKSQRITWLEGVGDDLLSNLYANSLFSVFPSFYEGWGLAATEAIAFGKVCVVSNNSSLGEATYNLMPSYHPLDFPGWLEEIKHLIDDDNYRKELERTLTDTAPRRTWENFANDFYNRLL